jgi:hypothetical protein
MSSGSGSGSGGSGSGGGGSEATLEARVGRYCKGRGILYYKFVSPSNRSVPDRMLLGFGRCMFLELKSPGRKPTPKQLHELERIAATGHTAMWSSDYEEIVRIINSVFPPVVEPAVGSAKWMRKQTKEIEHYRVT